MVQPNDIVLEIGSPRIKTDVVGSVTRFVMLGLPARERLSGFVMRGDVEMLRGRPNEPFGRNRQIGTTSIAPYRTDRDLASIGPRAGVRLYRVFWRTDA